MLTNYKLVFLIYKLQSLSIFRKFLTRPIHSRLLKILTHVYSMTMYAKGSPNFYA